MLSLSSNKPKTFWNIINIEIGTVSIKKFTQTEFKLGNKNISTNQSAKIFNNYFINSIGELFFNHTATKN